MHRRLKLYKEILSTTKKSKTARAEVEAQLSEDDITLPLYEKFNQLWMDSSYRTFNDFG